MISFPDDDAAAVRKERDEARQVARLLSLDIDQLNREAERFLAIERAAASLMSVLGPGDTYFQEAGLRRTNALRKALKPDAQ